MHHIKPIIQKKDGKQRLGRGFSREELKKAGLTRKEAKRIEIPIDPRRRTIHAKNVEIITSYTEKKKTEIKPKNKPKTEKS